MKFKRIMPKNVTKFEDKECIEYFMNTADLVTFTQEILNGELHFLYSVTHLYLAKMQ